LIEEYIPKIITILVTKIVLQALSLPELIAVPPNKITEPAIHKIVLNII